MGKAKAYSSKDARKECVSFMEFMADFSTLHGMAFYNIIQNSCFKAVVMSFLIVYFWSVVVLVALTIKEALLDESISRTVIEDHRNLHKLPQFTLCHPYYFDKKAIRALGIPEANLTSFSTFLSLPFDLVKLSKSYNASTIEQIKEFEAYKVTIMEKYQFKTVVELVENVSISCNQFVRGGLHFDFFIQDPCDLLFDPLPIWTSRGICYRTRHKDFVSYNPGIVSGLSLFVVVDPNIYADLDVAVYGTGLFFKRSPSFTFFNKLISFGVSSSLQNFQAKKITSVGVKLNKLNRANTEDHYLVPKDKQCKSNYPEFEEIFPELKNYSKSICNEVLIDYLSDNCTLLPFSRIPNARNISICTTEDMTKGPYDLDTAFPFEICPEDCHEEVYEIVETSVADMNAEFLQAAYGLSPDDPEMENSAALEIHMQSHTIVETKLYKYGIIDILSQAGGFLGLTMGASSVTLLETLFILGFTGRTLWRWLTKKPVQK